MKKYFIFTQNTPTVFAAFLTTFAKCSKPQTIPARAMPPRRMKNTPATLSILSSEVSSAEGLDKSGQDLLGHHLYTTYISTWIFFLNIHKRINSNS